MAIRNLKGSWWVDFQYRNKRIRKRSPVNTKPGARQFEMRLKNKIMNGESINEDTEKDKEQKFKAFAWVWFRDYVKPNNKHSEILSKKYVLKNTLIPYFGNTPINEITTRQVDKFKAEMLEKKLKKKTINNYLSILRKCLNNADDWYYLKQLPRIKLFKASRGKYDYLTEEKSELLLAHAEGVWHDMILTALRTGLRLGELMALDWMDIDFGKGILTVNHAIARGRLGTPKSGKSRIVPLCDDVFEALYNKRKESGYVFSNGDSYYRPKTCLKYLHRVCLVAGLEIIGWHGLRHSFASQLVTNGANIKGVQELLGHSDIQTTMRYTHINQSLLRETIGLLTKKCQPGVNRPQKSPKPVVLDGLFNEKILARIKENNPEKGLLSK